ncbi:MAG TPA: 16S rRNA (guanine(527)-N(7))-methyltransferase RsmG [Paracoccaceae bacterium]|nr:16S rRNA (guanine(527)-N(7))-methyltransferase RsmG [Paracoccaceae bacterium]
MTRANVLAGRTVSRETMDRLEVYEALLRKWNPAINLVSRSSLDQLWYRHFEDSAQIFSLCAAESGTWTDLGAGGGFPGLVVAILAVEAKPDLSVTLVESDQRKAAFLSTVAREVGVKARILPQRIEATPALGADVMSARALAPLTKLLAYADLHLRRDGQALFPKGATYREEIDQAFETWRFSHEATPSMTDPSSVILSIRDIERA